MEGGEGGERGKETKTKEKKPHKQKKSHPKKQQNLKRSDEKILQQMKSCWQLARRGCNSRYGSGNGSGRGCMPARPPCARRSLPAAPEGLQREAGEAAGEINK